MSIVGSLTRGNQTSDVVFWAGFISAGVSGLGNVIAHFGHHWRSEKWQPDEAIQTLLEAYLWDDGDAKVVKQGLRLNVLMPDRNGVLHSRFSVNMGGSPDRTLTWAENQGHIGYSFSTGKALAEDLSRFRHLTFEEVSAKMADYPIPWGLSRTHWQHLHGVGSALCVPIPHPTRSGRLIGVLVLDSPKPLAATDFLAAETQDRWSRRVARLGCLFSELGLVPK
jgi:hypothetical protein